MSEGSITYQQEDGICGIFTVINSELKNHQVCSDGLACIETVIEGEITDKQCHSVVVLLGERCVPEYDTCFGSVQCLLNPNNEYTCGGIVVWGGNPDYITTGYTKASEFVIDTTMLIVGTSILVMYMLLLVYELLLRDDRSIYSIIKGLFK
jgi:hypothetical protein